MFRTVLEGEGENRGCALLERKIAGKARLSFVIAKLGDSLPDPLKINDDRSA